MTVEELAKLTNNPSTHQLIVGDYEGSYALGVTADPPAFLLRVEPVDVAEFPHRVTIDGTTVPVVVEGGFLQPRPQRQ